MSANLEAKKLLVEEIKDKLQKAKTVVFVDYRGITVEQDTKMRKKFRESGSEYRVYKNRLIQIALKELGYDCPTLEGTTAVAFGYDDEVAPAKIVTDSATENCKLDVKFGIYNKSVVDQNTIKSLAKIPSREVLLAQLVGMLTSPMRGLAVCIKAIADKNN